MKKLNLIILLFSICSCSVTKETTSNKEAAVKEAEEWKINQLKTIKKKFSFDTGCKEELIELTVIETYSEANGEANYDKEHWRITNKPYCKLDWVQHQIMPKSVGAKGCGQKGTYVHVGNTWVLNSTSK